jgi:hypothetical protein
VGVVELLIGLALLGAMVATAVIVVYGASRWR